MSATTHYPHLTVGPSDQVAIEGTRYKVLHLAGEHYAYGWSAEELMRQHPDLRPEQIYSAMTFFYDHFDELVEQMKRSDQELEARRKSQSLSREALLSRRSGA